MAYTAHTWENGDVITADLLNAMEQGIQNEQVGPQGPKGDTGETGPQGPKGDTGEPGAGLTGAATVLTALAGSEELADVITKVNEIITALNARGVTKAE